MEMTLKLLLAKKTLTTKTHPRRTTLALMYQRTRLFARAGAVGMPVVARTTCCLTPAQVVFAVELTLMTALRKAGAGPRVPRTRRTYHIAIMHRTGTLAIAAKATAVGPDIALESKHSRQLMKLMNVRILRLHVASLVFHLPRLDQYPMARMGASRRFAQKLVTEN